MISKNHNSKSYSSQRGATLIEVMIYILLFSFIMSASLISINQILAYSYSASVKSSVEEEAAFVLAKINAKLNDATIVNASVPGELTVDGTTINLVGNNVEIDDMPLNSSRIRITNLNFVKTTYTGSITVNVIKTSFNAEGKHFESTRTIR